MIVRESEPSDRQATLFGLRSRILTPTVGLAGVLLSLFAYHAAHRADQRLFTSEFTLRAEERISVVEREFDNAVLVVDVLSSFLSASPTLDQDRFRIGTEKTLHRNPSIHALSFNRYVTARDRAAYEASEQHAGAADFEIKEISQDGRLARAGSRDDYIVVSFIEPLDANRRALGLDVASESTRREAFRRAYETGRPAVTGGIHLVQETEGEFGVLVASPVYRGATATERTPGQPNHLYGFVVGVFRIGDLVEQAISQLDPLGIHIRLTDESSVERELLYADPSSTGKMSEYGSSESDLHGPKGLAVEKRVEFAGRIWSIQCQPSDAYLASTQTDTPKFVLAVGLILTVLVVGYLVTVDWFNVQLGLSTRRHGETRTALGMSKRRFRQLLDDIAAVVWEVELPSWRLTFVSQQVEALLGYPIERWLTDDDLWRNVLHPADLKRVVECRMSHTEQCADHILEYRLISASGSTVWIQDIVHVAVDAQGRPQKLLGLLVDISERKRGEQERISIEGRLRQSQKMEALGTLASGVAHDLNNGFTSMLGYMDVLGDHVGQSEIAADALEALKEATTQAGAVTKALLTFSRKEQSEKAPGSFSKVVVSSIDMFRRAAPASIEVIMEPDELPDFWVAMDGRQIQQVIVNLAINARDAMPDGGVLRVSISSRASKSTTSGADQATGRDYVALTLQDTGSGMDSDVRERAFEPFFTTKPRGEGTGLGLAIVHGIVTDHGGSIEIDSDVRTGTRVTVLLPTCERADESHAADETSPSVLSNGGTILLGEDNDPIRKLVTESLEKQGYTVLPTADGEAFLNALKEHRESVDVIVLDVDLPKKDGLACLREARQSGITVPTILMSGLAVADLGGIESRGATFLQKPFRVKELATLVAERLPRGRASSETGT